MSISETVTVLLVGAEGVGKHAFAKGLLRSSTFPLQIRTVTQLPLPEGPRPRIDFIIFMIDLTSKESLKVVVKSLECLNNREYPNISCITALNVKRSAKRAIDLEVVTDLAKQSQCEIYFGSVETDSEIVLLAKQMICVIEITCGLKRNATPFLLKSTEVWPDPEKL